MKLLLYNSKNKKYFLSFEKEYLTISANSYFIYAVIYSSIIAFGMIATISFPLNYVIFIMWFLIIIICAPALSLMILDLKIGIEINKKNYE